MPCLMCICGDGDGHCFQEATILNDLPVLFPYFIIGNGFALLLFLLFNFFYTLIFGFLGGQDCHGFPVLK